MQEACNPHNRVRDDLQASLIDRLAEIPPGTAREKWNPFQINRVQGIQKEIQPCNKEARKMV